MTDPTGPGDAGDPGHRQTDGIPDEELVRRRQALDSALSSHRPRRQDDEGGNAKGTVAGVGQALRLSSEFIAGVAVGAGLGWLIDRVAGTSPWGLIVFLLLGFVAGVLNVLRSAGLMAEAGPKAGSDAGRRPGEG